MKAASQEMWHQVSGGGGLRSVREAHVGELGRRARLRSEDNDMVPEAGQVTAQKVLYQNMGILKTTHI